MPGASQDASDGVVPVVLSGPERSVLVALRAAPELPIDEEDLAAQIGLGLDQVRGSLQRLRAKHLVVLDEQHETVRRLTPRGVVALAQGLPERRFLSALERAGGSLTPERAAAEGLDGEERSAAIGILRRRGYLEDGVPFRRRVGADPSPTLLPEEVVLKQLANGEEEIDEAILATLERRGLVRIERHSVKRWEPS